MIYDSLGQISISSSSEMLGSLRARLRCFLGSILLEEDHWVFLGFFGGVFGGSESLRALETFFVVFREEACRISCVLEIPSNLQSWVC